MKKRFFSIASTIVLGFSIASAQTEMPSKPISGGVLNGKATTLAKPAYPAAARAVKAEGSVAVQVLIDEQGNIASATAVSGHPLLRQAAEQAALQSKFAPTSLSGQPVKVSGVIVYNFIAGASADNWVRTGFDLAGYEKFSTVSTYSLNTLAGKMPAEWTNEREQIKQLQMFATASAPLIAERSGVGSSSAKADETITRNVETTADDTVVKKMIIVRGAKAEEASAEQVSVVQNLTSSLQARLGSDPKAAWQFNLGIALGRAFSSARNQNDQQILMDTVRQQIAAAPSDINPEYLKNVSNIVVLLEAKDKTPEQRQQIIGQMSLNLFKD